MFGTTVLIKACNSQNVTATLKSTFRTMRVVRTQNRSRLTDYTYLYVAETGSCQDSRKSIPNTWSLFLCTGCPISLESQSVLTSYRRCYKLHSISSSTDPTKQHKSFWQRRKTAWNVWHHCLQWQFAIENDRHCVLTQHTPCLHMVTNVTANRFTIRRSWWPPQVQAFQLNVEGARGQRERVKSTVIGFWNTLYRYPSSRAYTVLESSNSEIIALILFRGTAV
jgi:hypothetical protein